MEIKKKELDHVVLITKAMEKRQIFPATLSSLTGISASHVYSILNHTRSVTPHNAIRIAKALKCFTAKELLIKQIDWQLERLGKG